METRKHALLALSPPAHRASHAARRTPGAFGKCLHAANPGHVLKRYYRIPDLPIQAYQEIWFEAANAVPRYFSRLDTQREKAQSHRRENGIKERAAFTLPALCFYSALRSSLMDTV